jgi:predicted amidohydrolase
MNRIAAVQMASGPNVGANLIEAERLICLAVDNGAKLVVLPENFARMIMAPPKPQVNSVSDTGDIKIPT